MIAQALRPALAAAALLVAAAAVPEAQDASSIRNFLQVNQGQP
jgi:hypothetical protein